MTSIKPEYWSSSLWRIMYLTAYLYPDEPTQEKKQEILQFLRNFHISIPCEKCKIHYIKYIENNSLYNAIKNRNNLLDWVNNLDKTVNNKNINLVDKIKEIEHYKNDTKTQHKNIHINALRSRFMNYGIRKSNIKHFNKAACGGCSNKN